MAEMDPISKTIPIRLAGTAIRNLIGYELTGRDFLDCDRATDEEIIWQNVRCYHDHPCGRYVELDANFKGGFQAECALTFLPLLGSKGERLLITYVETDDSPSSKHSHGNAIIPEPAKFACQIDIGGGVPDVASPAELSLAI